MNRRPLAALASVVLTVLGVVFLLPPDCASACSCAMPPGSRDALADSDAVFSGEVVAVEQGTATATSPGYDTATLRVSEAWKGSGRGTLEVRTPSQGTACGYRFEEGREYLVYAYTGKQGLEVDSCGATEPLSEAGADLAALGDGEKPQGGGGVLTDTSGDVSVRAMVGVAGLALAVSLLVVVRLVRSSQT
jgi:hypothetical protein